MAAILLCFSCCIPLAAQQNPTPEDIPGKFKLDIETAARLGPQLAAHSYVAAWRYQTGRVTLQNLVAQARLAKGIHLTWELRIADDNMLNAYSSPDGTIYVDGNLAELAGDSAGLWAAILSHEIEHIVRRDWARRYLFEHSLWAGSGGDLLLGEPGAASGTWMEERTASADLAGFCRQLELEADSEGLMLMARAGYHPDFVPALHHLLQVLGEDSSSDYALHPQWELRDREFQMARAAAGIEFERLWPDREASPGGDPPAVVFTEAPKITTKTTKTGAQEWALEVPITCRNLVGAVEVVLVTRPAGTQTAASLQRLSAAPEDRRQLTGCTSPRTTVTFEVGDRGLTGAKGVSVDVFILDAWGSVLSRADVARRWR